MSSSEPTAQESHKDLYELIYWGGAPGRGEHIRLMLEEAGADYTDLAHVENGNTTVWSYMEESNPGDEINTPWYAPPILKHGNVIINQTSNILLYLSKHLGLAPSETEDPAGLYRVNALVLTALDGLSDEPHDCHHPIAKEDFYEDQKTEALRKAKSYLTIRLPKFLGFFERVLKGPASGNGPWLYGEKLTYADLVLFHCIDGVKFSFPKAMTTAAASGKYDRLFNLYESVKQRPRIQEYLQSPRRQKYTMGIYRYYPELDFDLGGSA